MRRPGHQLGDDVPVPPRPRPFGFNDMRKAHRPSRSATPQLVEGLRPTSIAARVERAALTIVVVGYSAGVTQGFSGVALGAGRRIKRSLALSRTQPKLPRNWNNRRASNPSQANLAKESACVVT